MLSPRLDPGSPQPRAWGCWTVPAPCPSLSSSRVLAPRGVRLSGLSGLLSPGLSVPKSLGESGHMHSLTPPEVF